MHRAWRRTALLTVLTCGTGVFAQSSVKYPQPRRSDVADNYFGTTVADPYRWMEDLNAPEVKQWVDAEWPFAESLFQVDPR